MMTQARSTWRGAFQQSLAEAMRWWHGRQTLYDELAGLHPTEVDRLLGDASLDRSDLSIPIGSHQAERLLPQVMIRFGVDPETLARMEPGVMRDLQRTCMRCPKADRCRHRLAQGEGATEFTGFCPNAFTLSALSDGP